MVDLDLEKFFDRVNHDVLMSRIEKRVSDKRVLTLIRRRFLNAGVMDAGLVRPVTEGTPQGGPLSPLLSNLLLDGLDSRGGYPHVQKSDCHPERRPMVHLSAQGIQANQQIFFLSDSADNLRELQFGTYPESIHVLDWFHITMRPDSVNAVCKGTAGIRSSNGHKVLSLLESSKRYLWHGNATTALD